MIAKQVRFAPIFEKDGNRFFIPAANFTSENLEEAYQIGLGCMLVECIICEFRYTGKVQEVDMSNIPHVQAKLGPLPVAIIEGPLFDSAAEAV